MKVVAFVVFFAMIITAAALHAQTTQVSHGANSQNIQNVKGNVTITDAQKKAEVKAIKDGAGPVQPVTPPASATPVPITAEEKNKVYAAQRDILVAKNAQDTLKEQYDADAAKITAANNQLNTTLDELRKAHSLASDTPFDQDTLQFMVPKKAEEKK